MGLLDRLKTNRSDDDAGDARAPANFDELQAAGDDGRTQTLAVGRAADLDLPDNGSGMASPGSNQSIISELPPSEQLSDFSESRLMTSAGAGASAAGVGVRLTPVSRAGTGGHTS